jgi:hypothetical protein
MRPPTRTGPPSGAVVVGLAVGAWRGDASASPARSVAREGGGGGGGIASGGSPKIGDTPAGSGRRSSPTRSGRRVRTSTLSGTTETSARALAAIAAQAASAPPKRSGSRRARTSAPIASASPTVDPAHNRPPVNRPTIPSPSAVSARP